MYFASIRLILAIIRFYKNEKQIKTFIYNIIRHNRRLINRRRRYGFYRPWR